MQDFEIKFWLEFLNVELTFGLVILFLDVCNFSCLVGCNFK